MEGKLTGNDGLVINGGATITGVTLVDGSSFTVTGTCGSFEKLSHHVAPMPKRNS